jgi:hypothetical protein
MSSGFMPFRYASQKPSADAILRPAHDERPSVGELDLPGLLRGVLDGGDHAAVRAEQAGLWTVSGDWLPRSPTATISIFKQEQGASPYSSTRPTP